MRWTTTPAATITRPRSTGTIPQEELFSYIETARAITASGAEALWLQHEYGIFGGHAGEHILALLDRLTIPVFVTLHTVLEKPSVAERRVLEALLRRASRVMVMAERGPRNPGAGVRLPTPRSIVTIPARRARPRAGRSRDVQATLRLGRDGRWC